jgi:hypothetical protein
MDVAETFVELQQYVEAIFAGHTQTRTVTKKETGLGPPLLPFFDPETFRLSNLRSERD